MVFTRKDGDFHGQTVSFREGSNNILSINHVTLFEQTSVSGLAARHIESVNPVYLDLFIDCSLAMRHLPVRVTIKF